MKSTKKSKEKIYVLYKKRGNFAIHEKFADSEQIIDTTETEVNHHVNSLREAGFDVEVLKWSQNIMHKLQSIDSEMIFNASSLAETALLEEYSVCFVGSDLVACAIATDKVLAKKLWIKRGLPTSPFVEARTIEDCEVFKDNPPFKFPLFIKPSRGRGSSGIDDNSLVNSYEELREGVKTRLEKIGQPVLIERFLEGREITCGIIGNQDRIKALPLLEISHTGSDKFLTFDKKELDDDQFKCPADLDPKKTEMMQKIAIEAYKTIGLQDYGRIDMIFTEEGPFLLEANSFAGLMCTPLEKPHSYMGFMAKAARLSRSEFLSSIVKEAKIRLQL
jgi:D-alanine-D-alanine ligase